MELPPHTRRRDGGVNGGVNGGGTTSAYAEKRDVRVSRRAAIENYLRIRGEESLAGSH